MPFHLLNISALCVCVSVLCLCVFPVFPRKGYPFGKQGLPSRLCVCVSPVCFPHHCVLLRTTGRWLDWSWTGHGCLMGLSHTHTHTHAHTHTDCVKPHACKHTVYKHSEHFNDILLFSPCSLGDTETPCNIKPKWSFLRAFEKKFPHRRPITSKR